MRQIKYWLKRLFLLVLICAALEIIGNTDWMKTSALALSPLQGVVADLSYQIDDWLRGFVKFKVLSEKNAQLEAEVKALQDEKSRLLAYKVQNLRLQSLLALKAQLPGKIKISARVIARDPNDWGEKVILDRGRNDGVKENMVAVTPEGLVGMVSQVSSRACTLSLIGSESLAVPVALADSEVYGIMRTNKMMRSVIKYIRFDIPVKPGQLVVTSGLGDIYPGGLAVGRVERAYVSQEAMYQDVLVKLSAELPRLREVILIAKGDISADPNIFKDAIIRAEQEAKQAAKESAEAALRASNQDEALKNSKDDVDKQVREKLSASEYRSSARNDKEAESSAPIQNFAAPDSSIAADKVQTPSVDFNTGSKATVKRATDDKVETASSTSVDNRNEVSVEAEVEPKAESSAEGAESHYITVEETEESAPEASSTGDIITESEPTPNVLEFE